MTHVTVEFSVLHLNDIEAFADAANMSTPEFIQRLVTDYVERAPMPARAERRHLDQFRPLEPTDWE